MARVLINHGWNNRRPVGHWHRNLAVALKAQGHSVSYPQFPNPDQPILEEWQDLLVAELNLLREIGPEAGELIFIGHSLGCINYLQAAGTGIIGEPLDRVLLVAPAAPSMLGEIPGVNADPRDAKVKAGLHASAKSITIVGSDQDPWSPDGVQETFGDPLGLQAIIIPGAKHLSLNDGWGEWQGVIDWVNDASADIASR